MQIIKTELDFEKIKIGTVLTIGNFDGVHIGHQAILSTAKSIAAQRQTEIVVMTFWPHPLSIINPQKAPGALTPPALKEHLLAELGVGTLFTVKSEPEILGLTADDFVEQFISKTIRPSAIIEGEDFNFGRKRMGSVYTLQKLAVEKNIDVFIVEPKKAKLANDRTVEVSSTMIRNMVTEGKVADAAILLGRPYRLIGNIVPGRGKGKKLGFPTLNLEKPQQIIPIEGVYAGLVEIGNNEKQVCFTKEKILATFSIGRATTYGAGQSLLLEAHLLSNNADRFTGRWMSMDFIERIRDQKKFENEKKLAEQIGRDCQTTKKILHNLTMNL